MKKEKKIRPHRTISLSYVKSYDNLNNIVYELNDGKGYIKEYWDDGKLIFESEYLND